MKNLTAVLTFAVSACLTTVGHAMLVIDEDFEDATITYSTSVAEFSDNGNDFFGRVAADGISVSGSYDISNIQGSGFFAAQDTNGDGGPNVLTLTWDDVNIAGLSDLVFSGLFAEDDDGSAQDWDGNSSVQVQFSLDNGSLQDLFTIEAEGGTNTVPRVDDDFNGTGEGAEITDTLTEYTRSISGTGTLLDLVITISNLNDGDEDIAFDDIQVSGVAVAIPEPSAFLFGGLICGILGTTYSRKQNRG